MEFTNEQLRLLKALVDNEINLTKRGMLANISNGKSTTMHKHHLGVLTIINAKLSKEAKQDV